MKQTCQCIGSNGNDKSPLVLLFQRGKRDTGEKFSRYPPLKKGGRGDLEIKKTGFTLIEILVAMSILVIVLTAALVIFRTAASSYRKGEIRAQRYQEARFVMERISREIFSLAPLSANGPYCIGTENTLYFVTASIDAPGALLEAGYRLDAQNKNLLRSYHLIPDYDYQTFDEEEIFCPNVSHLSFEYADGENWQGSWDSRTQGGEPDILPRAVKFGITIEDAKNSESFTTIVVIPSAW